MKKRIVVSESGDVDGTEFDLLSYQRAVQEWVESVPEEHRADAVVVYEGDDEPTSVRRPGRDGNGVMLNVLPRSNVPSWRSMKH